MKLSSEKKHDAMTDDAFYRLTELDRTTWPEIRDQILQFEHVESLSEPRSYPGYPHWPLAHVSARLWPPLDRVLRARRSQRRLGTDLPARKTLSRLLLFAHGVHAELARGPVPSSGGLQSLELYLVNFATGWLPTGLYHYDRAGHHLAQIAKDADRLHWQSIVPSLPLVEGSVLLWVLVGDGARIAKKYGPRGNRFLLLEAGHLMQNLCLLSASLGLGTVPLGGFFEGEVRRAFTLLPTDVVAYLGVLGGPATPLAA
ncbi:MAG: SagB/ThcOx family dehydrogenase [Gemmataceae bacterium]|nr:SagB/ThcOx family dehydrogenase [Gemmataceae bacterium]